MQSVQFPRIDLQIRRELESPEGSNKRIVGLGRTFRSIFPWGQKSKPGIDLVTDDGSKTSYSDYSHLIIILKIISLD